MLSPYPTWSEQAALLKEEGREKGREEGRESVARNLLGMGFSHADIQKATQLSLDAILSPQSGAKDLSSRRKLG
jgi:predicted transposase YdaD